MDPIDRLLYIDVPSEGIESAQYFLQKILDNIKRYHEQVNKFIQSGNNKDILNANAELVQAQKLLEKQVLPQLNQALPQLKDAVNQVQQSKRQHGSRLPAKFQEPIFGSEPEELTEEEQEENVASFYGTRF